MASDPASASCFAGFVTKVYRDRLDLGLVEPVQFLAMRVLFACTLVVGLAGISHADPDAGSAIVGHGAMPGGITVADAVSLPEGAFELQALGGFGYRKGLLATDHRFFRGIGDLAF